jgi:SPP1 gp7 family putative phage head morphogenesis protein
MNYDIEYKKIDNDTEKKESSLIKDIAIVYAFCKINNDTAVLKSFTSYNIDGNFKWPEMQKYNRFDSLIKQQVSTINETYKNIKSTLNKRLEEVYTKNSIAIDNIIKKESINQGIDKKFKSFDVSDIKNSIQSKISGMPLNERLEKHRQDTIYKTKEQITQGIIKGEGIDKIIKRLEDINNKDIEKTNLIIRTEINRIRNEAKNEGFKRAQKLGLKCKKVWMARMDYRTREIHRGLNETFADENGIFHFGGFETEYPGGFGIASLDINCRCTTYILFGGTK